MLILLTLLSSAPTRAEGPPTNLSPYIWDLSQGGEWADTVSDIDEIVFTVRKPGKDGHWYANFGHYATDTNRLTYEEGSGLYKLNLRTKKLTPLIEDPKGSLRDPQIHYDGEKILFSYRKGGESYFNLYETDLDGSGLTQITEGPWDDIEPTYLPDDRIVFCSSRCKRWVNCWLTQVAVLHRCDPDGGNIEQLSSNGEHENTPWPLPDGRILYQRWEYIDRSQVHYHHLWTMNPDGTNQRAFFGNMHPGIVMIDAKPIPGTDEVVSVFSPGHGRKDHDGVITVVDPKGGPDDQGSAETVNPSNNFRDPYPLSEDCFLVVSDSEILLMNRTGETQLLFALSDEDREAGFECHEPRPVQTRPRERMIPDRRNPDKDTGFVFLADVNKGRSMEGVQPGEIKKLLVIESLPKPINYTGGMEPLSYGGTFTLERIMGTVPVEPDGSAYLELPAMRSFFFVALDDQDLSVKRMQSFLTLQPGEVVGCVGCHEQRTQTFIPDGNLMAMSHPPSQIKPIENIPDVFDYPRDIQPILDRHCVDCHGYETNREEGPRAGGVILTGDRGPLFSHSYFMLTARQQVADGRNRPQSNYPPRTIGSSASPLMKKIDGSHYGVEVTKNERDRIRLWIETGASYPGTYAGLGSGMIGGYEENRIDRSDTEWPSMKAAMEVLQKRCGSCHTGGLALPTSPSDNMKMPPWEIKYEDPRLRFSRHILYNLTRPEFSLQLLAPLAKNAGGYEICSASDGSDIDPNNLPVFKDTSDPDYQTLLAAILETQDRLNEIKRFDMAGFQPRPAYIREMKRFGILPQDLGTEGSVDPYAADRAYWKSLWHQPAQN
ncbi:MAG: hypothetical protein H6751_14795 [Candidatus Omnitrophica bacterium]|nr:hypothetical protein [Candidatus Omnitrophota bacterium]